MQASASRSMYNSKLRLSNIDVQAENSIKRNKVKAFVNAGTSSNEPVLQNNDKNTQLAGHLLQLKNSCSGVKIDIRSKEFEQYKYRDEINFTAEKVRALQKEREQIENQISTLKRNVEQVKAKRVITTHSLKSYEHMLERMRKDEIKHQLRRNDLERHLYLLEKEYRELDIKMCQLREFEQMSANGLKDAQEAISEQSMSRKKKLSDINSKVEEKHMLQRKQEQRKNKTDIIKEMAAGDLQDADLIRMKKFLAAQVFLKAVLKSKIEKLKEFYRPYETAFLKIKSNTAVRDATSLQTEYFNFEANYSEKAVWVKHLQEEAGSIEEERKRLAEQLTAEKSRELDLLEGIEVQESNVSTLNKKEIMQNSSACELKMMRVKEWFKTQLQRLGQEYDYSMEDSEAIQLICQQLLTRKETMNAKIVPESIQEKDPTNEEEKESSESCQRDEIVPDKLE